MLFPAAPDRSEEDLFEEINATTFAFKPVAESGSSFFTNGASKVIMLLVILIFCH